MPEVLAVISGLQKKKSLILFTVIYTYFLSCLKSVVLHALPPTKKIKRSNRLHTLV
jgi:hypothetical protein